MALILPPLCFLYQHSMPIVDPVEEALTMGLGPFRKVNSSDSHSVK